MGGKEEGKEGGREGGTEGALIQPSQLSCLGSSVAS